MSHIHATEELQVGDVLVVNCSHQCNIMLMTNTDYGRYRRGEKFQYHGGHFTKFPTRFLAPGAGSWNVVIDVGERAAEIRYDIRVIRK